LEPPDIPDQV